MWLRLLVCFALALAAVAATQVWPANSASELDYTFKDRKPVPRPPEVAGWILVRVCSVTGKLDHRFTEWAYLRPSAILGIGNPPTSPDPCIALHGITGKRLFVEGVMEDMARYIMDATGDSL